MFARFSSVDEAFQPILDARKPTGPAGWGPERCVSETTPRHYLVKRLYHFFGEVRLSDAPIWGPGEVEAIVKVLSLKQIWMSADPKDASIRLPASYRRAIIEAHEGHDMSCAETELTFRRGGPARLARLGSGPRSAGLKGTSFQSEARS